MRALYRGDFYDTSKKPRPGKQKISHFSFGEFFYLDSGLYIGHNIQNLGNGRFFRRKCILSVSPEIFIRHTFPGVGDHFLFHIYGILLVSFGAAAPAF
jgi:hypothetical protein